MERQGVDGPGLPSSKSKEGGRGRRGAAEGRGKEEGGGGLGEHVR